MQDTLGAEPIYTVVKDIEDACKSAVQEKVSSPPVEAVPSATPLGLTLTCHATAVGSGLGTTSTQKNTAIISAMSEDDAEQLKVFQQDAVRRVREFIELKAEPGTCAELTSMISNSVVGQMMGDEKNGYILIYIDASQLGESQTQPSVRKASVQNGIVKKLLTAAVEARGSASDLGEWDLWAVTDGGKHGNETVLTTLVNNAGKGVPKNKKTVYLVYSEQAIESLKEAPSRGAATIHQVEMLHFMTQKCMRVSKKPRKHAEGTTASTAITQLNVPKRSEGWQLDFKSKKECYGNLKRILASGPADIDVGSGECAPRKDTNEEPFNFWAKTTEFYHELLNYDVKAVIHLTASEGNFAKVCADAGIPYFGLAYTATHVDMLYKYLNSVMFKSFIIEGSPNFKPDAAKLMREPEPDTPTKPTKPTKSVKATMPSPENAPPETQKAKAKCKTKSQGKLSQAELMRRIQALQKEAESEGGEDEEHEEGDDDEEP